MFYKNTLSYFLTFLVISFWWLSAFKNPIANETRHPPITKQKKQYTPTSISSLLNLDRKEIHLALDGDFRLIKKLIAKWDLEAEYLEQLGYKKLKRLAREDYVFSQLHFELDDTSQTLLIDQLGVPFDLSQDYGTFFPQTYCSAEILLSLVDFADLKKVVAIPASLSNQCYMQANPKINKILYKIDQFHSEKMYEVNPGIAIVADYSLPQVIESLKVLDIPLFLVRNIENFIDLKKMIETLGYLSKEYNKSRLLHLFIDAAMNAIDNKRTVQLESADFTYEDILLVQLYKRHSLPSTKSLLHACIERIGINKKVEIDKGSETAQLPFSEEDMILYNPKTLLIVTDKQENTLDYVYKMRYTNYIDAAKNQSIYLLDEQVQKATSQYIVLAYYDINNCLVKLYE